LELKDALSQRRSIRKFKETPIPREDIEGIIEAAIKAPSGKNLQPWHFIVISGKKKQELVELITQTAKKLQDKGIPTGSCLNSARAMGECPCLIFIYHTHGSYNKPPKGTDRYLWSVNIQSIGAAIQNMLLEATSRGIGSLWICDVFFADKEITEWLGRKDELVAAVALGYPGEAPGPAPRKNQEKVTEWIGEEEDYCN